MVQDQDVTFVIAPEQQVTQQVADHDLTRSADFEPGIMRRVNRRDDHVFVVLPGATRASMLRSCTNRTPMRHRTAMPVMKVTPQAARVIRVRKQLFRADRTSTKLISSRSSRVAA